MDNGVAVFKAKVAITIALLIMSARVAADPDHPCVPSAPCHLHMRAETILVKDDGHQFRLPPGHFLDDPAYLVLDDTLHGLQDAKTRLTAENQSLRGAVAGWQPGWLTFATALVGGFVGGFATYYYVTHR